MDSKLRQTAWFQASLRPRRREGDGFGGNAQRPPLPGDDRGMAWYFRGLSTSHRTRDFFAVRICEVTIRVRASH